MYHIINDVNTTSVEKVLNCTNLYDSWKLCTVLNKLNNAEIVYFETTFLVLFYEEQSISIRQIRQSKSQI